MRRRIPALLSACLVLALLLSARKREKDPVFAQIHSIVRSLSQISGFSEEHPVEYDSISKKQLHKFLKKRVKKTLRPDEIRADELALKMFGLVPDTFDLRKSTVDLLTEQAAAFYDYDEKKLFLLEGAPLSEETTTLAHELGHALVDQHFDLAKFMDEAPSNDDENLAHTAVVEGQASWLMIAYDLAAQGKSPIPTPEMLRSVESADDSSSADYPVLKASPLYIQQSLLFPYTEGTRFFAEAFQKMGKEAFKAVFDHPPVSSSQILHPQKYFNHENPSVPDLPKLNVETSEDEVTEGTLGEFDHRVLLWQFLGLPKANLLSPHLRGAQFRVSGGSKKRKPLLEYVSRWDSEKSAAEYFAAYKEVLRRKWKHCDATLNTGSAFSGSADDGFFVTHLNGDTLVSVEGLAEPASWASLRGDRQQREAFAKLDLSYTGD